MNADEWNEIHRLHTDGMSIKGIAAALAMSRNTVRRALSFDAPPADHRARSGSVADAYAEQIRRLIHEEPDLTIAQIAERVGWDRSRTTLARRVEQERRRAAGEGTQERGRPGDRTMAVPAFATEFIGRRAELHAIRTLLGGHRVVTIAGVGGVGKTRLAAQAAQEFRRAFGDGVRMIELASLRNADLLPQAVVDGLGMAHRDQPGRSVVETLVENLRDRHMLIVLDNCEHVREACAAFVHDVLRSTSRVRFLTTSREVLDVPGEQVTFLEPLPTSGTGMCDDATTAMALFESRARDILSGFAIDDGNREVIRQVCKRLDGIPLAIELACVRLRVLSVTELADRLDDGFALLSTRARGGQERHQSLQAAMAWSYELCTPPQRLLWARSSIFAGGFDAGMAEAVCSVDELPPDAILDCIYDLVGKSVLRREETGGRVRFRILETIREFGQGMLSDAERAELRQRHLEWCARLITTSVAQWFSGDQHDLAAQLRTNLANLRTALQTALAHSDAPSGAAATELVAAPWFLWACGLSAREHTMWLEQVVAMTVLTTNQRARVLGTLGMVQTLQGDRASADPNLREALSLAAEAEDATATAFATNGLGLSAFFAGDRSRGEPLLRESIERYERLAGVRGDLACTPYVHLGMLLSFDGRTEEAARCFERVQSRCESAGERWMRSYAVYGLGLVALTEERYAEAAVLARTSLRLRQDFDDSVGTPLAIELLGWAEAGGGSAARAAVLLGAAFALWGFFGQQLYGSTQWMDRRARFEQRARTELGDGRFAGCQARGASMSLGDLMELAAGDHPATGQRPRGSATLVTGLSPREREVARYIAEGLSNKQIADALVLSPRTIEGHVERILQKLGMQNRNQVAVAIATGAIATT